MSILLLKGQKPQDVYIQCFLSPFCQFLSHHTPFLPGSPRALQLPPLLYTRVSPPTSGHTKACGLPTSLGRRASFPSSLPGTGSGREAGLHTQAQKCIQARG